MKTDFSKLPREEMEARITTMLLSEMPAEEAAELREYISQDTALQKLHDDLKQTISLVTEASAEQPQQLSLGRREELLESFKMVRPAEPVSKHERDSWRTWAALAAMIVFLFAVSGVISPPLTKSRSSGKSVAYSRGDEDRKFQITVPSGGRGRVAIREDQRSARLLEERALERAKQDLAKIPGMPPQVTAETLSTAAGRRISPTSSSTKIELPVAAESETQLRQNGQENNWAMQGGQARGYGFGGAGPQSGGMGGYGVMPRERFADAEGKKQSVPRGNTLPSDEFVAGKDLSLAYGFNATTPAALTPEFDASRTAPSGFFDSLAAADAKKNGVIDLQREPEAIGLLESPKEQGVAAAIDPRTGLPSAPGSAVNGQIDPTTGLPSAAPKTVANANEEASQMGGMGGGANMSMMYYMSNPELMKRYFPQMYSMMQKGQQAGVGDANASAGLPGLAGAKIDTDRLDSLGRRPAVDPAQVPPMAMVPAFTDPYARYRAPGSAPTAAKPPVKTAPGQQVALGSELKSVAEQNEVDLRRKELADVSKKSELAVSTDKNGLVVPVDTAAVVDESKKAEESIAIQKEGVSAIDGSVSRAANVIQQRRQLLNAPASGTKIIDFENSDKITEATKAVRELETLRNLRASVDQRILQETTDKAIPKGGMVEIVDLADAGNDRRSALGDTPILGRLFKGSEERVARLEVMKDAADIIPLMPNQQSSSYDPYFIQTEAEKIRSQKILGDVIDDLKLDQKWSQEEGRKLNRAEALDRLKKSIAVEDNGNGLLSIRARGEKGAEAAQIANKIAEVYRKERLEQRNRASDSGIAALNAQLAELDQRVAQKEAEVAKLRNEAVKAAQTDEAISKPKAPAGIPQPEISTADNAFSTFSLNVSDVSFKLAAASLEKGVMPEAATVRSEEFINAFDYHDPEPQGAPIGFVWERARYPFAQDRDLLRFSVKTAASGRQAGKPLNIVLLLDSSGSMERADRVRILNECLKALATQLRPEDRISVVAFARTARLWVDGLPGNQANELTQRVGDLNPEGGTNLEEAMRVAYETARKHFTAEGVNRVVLLTDGAANLGDVEPESLKRKVETERKKGIALDCFGIGWEGLNDELLEALSRNGDGRYGFVNTPEAAASEFAGQLAGALQVAAADVKVQVEWNPKRVTAYRQIGYAKHQLTKEQFRDNTVDAAEIGAAEAGNALYTVQVNAAGEGPLGTVRVRFKVPGTSDYREHAWPLNYDGAPKPLENSSYPLRLAGTASAFSEWLVSSPYATEVTSDRLLTILSGVPEHFAPDPRPKKLEWMIRQAKSLAGK